jgi:hypothetical protein
MHNNMCMYALLFVHVALLESSFDRIPKAKFLMYKMIMIANVHEIRVFECDTQDFVLTILLDIEPLEFGMNFDAG